MRKQTKRKHYQLINPILHAIEGAAIVSGSKLDKLCMLELSSIESFRTGKATLQDWQHIASMMNIAEEMSRLGVGVEVIDCCERVQEHLEAAAKRFQTTGRMGLTGEGLQAVRDLYEYHHLQRKSVSLSEYERHIQNTANRVRSKAPEVVEL